MALPATITIVIPVFNVREYLESALKSIVRQSEPPSEVIIIDDGSTDGSSQILERYTHLPNWKIVGTLNGGLGPARNLGRMLSESEYIYFFDSDDLLERNFIEMMHRVIKECDNPDMIMFSGQSFYGDGFEHPFSPAYKRTISGVFERGAGLVSEMYRRDELFASACLYVSKAELWSRNCLNFPPILHEDEAVFFPLLALSEKTVVLRDVFFHRRVRAGSIMTSGVDSRNVSGILRVVHETMEFMSREPALAKHDIVAWRARVALFGVRYISLCRKTWVAISWAAVMASLITARSVKYPLRIAYSFFPEPAQGLIRRLKQVVRGV